MAFKRNNETNKAPPFTTRVLVVANYARERFKTKQIQLPISTTTLVEVAKQAIEVIL
jgi:hypothetical protein